MIVRRMLQLFNLLITMINNSIDFDKLWNDEKELSNLSFEDLIIGCSRFKVNAYPEIEKFISSYDTFSDKYSFQGQLLLQYRPLFCKLLYIKLSIFIIIMEVLLYLSKHSQINNYIAHHLYDNANTSYTTFIHQPSCNALLCQHQSYLDRECACKFLLVINRWFFSMAKMENFYIQNNIIDNLLHEISNDINITGNYY